MRYTFIGILGAKQKNCKVFAKLHTTFQLGLKTTGSISVAMCMTCMRIPGALSCDSEELCVFSGKCVCGWLAYDLFQFL